MTEPASDDDYKFGFAFRLPDADVVTFDGQSIATDPFRKTHNP